ncbi:protein SHQ1 homolog [Asterias amurensis]|uniref:protein SHQ1 homolog n=1 Tax=Asterias amurensis TaxID=7602 RepID=UPI003AB8C56D
MLTPSFVLTQDADFLRLLIKARYAKVTDVETFVDGNDFKFYAKPYFLRLHLPGRVIEDGRERAKYDVDSGSFEICLPKETPGEVFQGLDMLTKLLTPKGQRSAEQPGIEVIGENGNEGEALDEENADDQGEIDWQMEQKPFQQEEDALMGETHYGFANKRSGVFQRLQEELCDVVDVPNPDTMHLKERRTAKGSAENEKFDGDHYLADLYQEDTTLDELQNYKPSWHPDWKSLQAKTKQASIGQETYEVQFTEGEREQMVKLPNRRHLLDDETERGVLLGLVDIIFAYAYNARTTLGENSVESAWTICKLSPTLSWLDWFKSLDEVMTACYRRALCYPLYRHWDLTRKIYQDVKRIFQLGRGQLLKCLLETHQILAGDDPRYILNELYITDYCIWIQSVSHVKIQSLATALKKVKITKSSIGFELEELEAAAALVNQDDNGEQSEQPESIEQFGYPHILHQVMEADVEHGLPSEMLADKGQDVKCETKIGDDSQILNKTECKTLSEHVGKDKDNQAEETTENEIVSKLSAMKLQSTGLKGTEDLLDTASKPESLSLDAWAAKPPSMKIEVFDEDVTDIPADNQSNSQDASQEDAGCRSDEERGIIKEADMKMEEELRISLSPKNTVTSHRQEPQQMLEPCTDKNHSRLDSDSESGSESDDESDSESDEDTDSDSESGTDSDSDTDSELDTAAGPDSEFKTGPNIVTNK